MKALYSAALVAVMAFTSTACVSNLKGDTYSRDEARRAQEVNYGTVQNVRLVVIEGTKSNVGTAAGGVIGGIAGSTVGDGTGSALGTAVGAVIGGLFGAAAEEGMTRQQGVEVTVQMEDGRLLAVVQGQSEENFVVGERVRVIGSYGNLRVTR